MRRAFLAVSSLVAAACLPPSVTVTPAGSGLELPPRDESCQIEFFRTKPPERPYDEIAALHIRAHRQDDAAAAQEAMRQEACALGADGVVVTRDYALEMMTGTAVSYRDLQQKHRLDAALERAQAERAAAEQAVAREAAAKEAEARRAAKPGSPAEAARAGPPAGFVQARVKRLATTYDIADRRGKEVGDLSTGAPVWATPKASGGWRRIWLPGEQRAWIEDDALELRAAPAAETPASEPAPKVGGSHTDV